MRPGLAVFKGDRPSGNSSAQHLAEYVNAAAKQQLVTVVEYSDLVFNFGAETANIEIGSSGERLEDIAEAYYVRDYHGYHHERYTITRYLSAKKCHVYNSDLINNETLSKLEQMAVFCFNALPIPRTFFSNNLVRIETATTFPLVVKNILGSNGRLNFLVHSKEELQDALKKAGNKALIQAYIENEGDYRVVIMYGEPVIAYRRVRPKASVSHLNNVAQGAKREIIDEPDVLELAIKAAGALRREFCGIDIIRDKNDSKLYLLESNFNAGMHILDDGVDQIYFRKAAELIKEHSAKTD